MNSKGVLLRMKKRVISMLLIMVLLLSIGGVASPAGAATSQYRLLAIGDGAYGGQATLSPAPENDAKALQSALKKDTNYTKAYVYTNIKKTGNTIKGDPLLGNGGSFNQLIARAYSGATDADVSVFYFSGHSTVVEDTNGSGQAALLLVDMTTVTAKQLKTELDKVKGKKIVLLDICNSGDLIGKSDGDIHAEFISEFAKDAKAGELAASGYFVLTASSRSELSWQDNRSGLQQSSTLMGVFTRAMVQGLGHAQSNNRAVADQNMDGKITLLEILKQAENTNFYTKPQIYPEDSSQQIMRYTVNNSTKPLITNLASKPTNGSSASSSMYSFTFDLNRPATIRCSIIQVDYKRGTQALMEVAFVARSSFAKTDAGKGKKVTWDAELFTRRGLDWDTAFYFVVEESGVPAPYILPFIFNPDIKPTINVGASQTFKVGGGREAFVAVLFSAECKLTVDILDSKGKVVRNLATNDRAYTYGRVEELTDAELSANQLNRNMYYWNGKNEDGAVVPAGDYTVKVVARYGGGSVTKSNAATIKVTK